MFIGSSLKEEHVCMLNSQAGLAFSYKYLLSPELTVGFLWTSQVEDLMSVGHCVQFFFFLNPVIVHLAQ